MAEAGLDQLVKGAPPPNVSLPSVAAAAATTPPPASPAPSDPTSLLPSSPPQIYLNLLILEASLRSQYLTLRARRRQNTFVLILLGIWIAYFVYCQFLRPRADGGGVGGSEYWLVDVIEKVALLSGVVMSLLFKLTGQWERGVRWPSRWLRTTNRGIRGMNCKIVVLKGPWWKDMMSHLSFLFPISTLVETPGSNYQQIEYNHVERGTRTQSSRPRKENKEIAEEDIALGGDYIKILLLPKHFTPEFRDNWDTYRAEYWDLENRRRAELRQKFRAKQREIAQQQSPWFWWVPGRRVLVKSTSAGRTGMEMEKLHPLPSGNVTRGGSQRHRRAASVIKDEKVSHSRSSSRSSVGPAADADERERRWSTSTTSSIGGERRRRKATGTSVAPEITDRRGNPTGRVKLPPASTARPTTPNATDVLRTRSSNLSSMSSGSDGDSPRRRRRTVDVAIKQEPVD
jgi:hypothetical protein